MISDAWALLLATGVLSSDEVLAIIGRSAPSRALTLGERLNFNSLSEEDWKYMFRFDRGSIICIRDALEIGDYITLSNRSKFSALEGVCILMRRMAYPTRCGDLGKLFCRTPSAISMVFIYMVYLVFGRFKSLLKIDSGVIGGNLQQLADAVSNAGAPLRKCVGFVDGTVRPVSRPSTTSANFITDTSASTV